MESWSTCSERCPGAGCGAGNRDSRVVGVVGMAVGMEAVMDGGDDEAGMDTLVTCVTMRVEMQWS